MLRNEHSLERVPDGEMAFHLEEFDELDGDLLVRWQEIMVLHYGRPCKHVEPLGPSMAYQCGPVKILATVTDGRKIQMAGDTAGDLREHADRYRESNFMKEILDERKENSTLFEDYVKFREMRKQILKTHSRTVRNNALQHSTI